MNNINDVLDENLKRQIKYKAIKAGCRPNQDYFIRYDGKLYLVNLHEDRVVRQLEFK